MTHNCSERASSSAPRESVYCRSIASVLQALKTDKLTVEFMAERLQHLLGSRSDANAMAVNFIRQAQKKGYVAEAADEPGCYVVRQSCCGEEEADQQQQPPPRKKSAAPRAKSRRKEIAAGGRRKSERTRKLRPGRGD